MAPKPIELECDLPALKLDVHARFRFLEAVRETLKVGEAALSIVDASAPAEVTAAMASTIATTLLRITQEVTGASTRHLAIYMRQMTESLLDESVVDANFQWFVEEVVGEDRDDAEA